MRNANLQTRLEALERGSGSASRSVLVVGPYAQGADGGAQETIARAEWEERNGRPVPTDMRVMHFVLCGRKPGDGGHAH